jgi:fatty acid desaturase
MQRPPIHARLNIALIAVVHLAAAALLWAGSRLGLVWSLPLGIVFSFLLLTNYALIHEGTHDNLHPDPRSNRWLGMLAGFLFPVPFSMIKVTHAVHHCCNRTDHESRARAKMSTAARASDGARDPNCPVTAAMTSAG